MTQSSEESDARTSDSAPPVFSYNVRKDGSVEIAHHGRVVTVMRGHNGRDFLRRVEGAAANVAQRLMAQATGNYRRGNERTAGQHPRNRR